MNEYDVWDKLYGDEEYDARHAYGKVKNPYIRGW